VHIPTILTTHTPDLHHPQRHKKVRKRSGRQVWQDILGPDLSLEYLDKVNLNRDNERYLSLALGGLNQGVTPFKWQRHMCLSSAKVYIMNR